MSGNSLADPMQHMQGELRSMAEKAVGNDMRVARFAAGMNWILREDIAVQEVVSEQLQLQIEKHSVKEAQYPEQAAYFVRKLFGAVQKQLWRPDVGPSYPHSEAYLSGEHWRGKLCEMFVEDTHKTDEIVHDLSTRELMSNVGQRYIVPKTIVEAVNHRFNGETRFLDVGCSVMIGDRKLMSTGRSSLFDPPSIRDRPYRGSWGDKKIDHELSEMMTGIAMGEYAARDNGHHTGVDIAKNINEETIAWARSNSFYPKEIIEKPNLVKIFDDLIEQGKAPDVASRMDFISADFSKPLEGALQEREFDVVFLSTMMYQMTPEERQQVMRNAMEVVSDNGLIVVQDGADLDVKNDPDNLKYSAVNFRLEYRYRTYVIDMLAKERGLQPFMVWKDGRCRDGVFVPSRFTLEAIQSIRRNPTIA